MVLKGKWMEIDHLLYFVKITEINDLMWVLVIAFNSNDNTSIYTIMKEVPMQK
jgi:hypothetical protein